MSEPHRAERAPGAVERILDAAAACVVASGAAATSLSDIAHRAGVSKALIHYHFHDKDTLLAQLVERTAAALVARERAALAGEETALAVDALWSWLAAELEQGTIRLLVELALDRSPPVREASARATEARREAAAHTVARLFGVLELRPRVPDELLAAVTVAFVDGLAVQRQPTAQARVAFDVFWLAMLDLAE